MSPTTPVAATFSVWFSIMVSLPYRVLKLISNSRGAREVAWFTMFSQGSHPSYGSLRDAVKSMCMYFTKDMDEMKMELFDNDTCPLEHISHLAYVNIWVRSRNCGCLVTWFCYQLIAKPGNKRATVSWPNQYIVRMPSSQRAHDIMIMSLQYNYHIMGYFSAFWSSSKLPRAT